MFSSIRCGLLGMIRKRLRSGGDRLAFKALSKNWDQRVRLDRFFLKPSSEAQETTTAAAFLGLPVRAQPPDIRKRARTKLEQIYHTVRLDDLKVPPGNMLEALSGDRAGQHSIRINQQWRVCFVWHGSDAFDVEIVDYH